MASYFDAVAKRARQQLFATPNLINGGEHRTSKIVFPSQKAYDFRGFSPFFRGIWMGNSLSETWRGGGVNIYYTFVCVCNYFHGALASNCVYDTQKIDSRPALCFILYAESLLRVVFCRGEITGKLNCSRKRATTTWRTFRAALQRNICAK